MSLAHGLRVQEVLRRVQGSSPPSPLSARRPRGHPIAKVLRNAEMTELQNLREAQNAVFPKPWAAEGNAAFEMGACLQQALSPQA